MIYFVRAIGSDHVKIGYTKDAASMNRRLKALQTGQPWKLEILRTVDGDMWLESWYHQLFHRERMNGEWFNYCPAMRDAVPDIETVLRHQPRMEVREYLENMIERMISVLDQWDPDPDFEPEQDHEPESDDEPESDHEPDSDEYIPIKHGDPLLAFYNQIPDEDSEATQTEVIEL